ncbi:class I SAM-dependent methyltransferase [Kineococcus rhizosphaerae]|uniref:Methyltransferase family protein n=1 Tax=Kineococcus rhizosphaerae TaxID=559628 RepID=A0A2T0R2W3_9ACTN|nr:class I SAM-dependent methyltransferase [Kineococcus rhizosphaerae]PRY14136.1 methyltransferase family protein [Kineococcus rhizosphaerae]
MASFDPTARDARELWEGMYAQHHGHVWSGRPNAALVDAVDDLTPGTALDLGCGEGGDVLFLARQGWTVTGVDVSDTALARAREHADEAGVRARFERHDLGVSFPEGAFDLVTASFLHSYAFLDRLAVLRRAAAAVAPGGSFLVLGHVTRPEQLGPLVSEEFPDAVVDLPTPEELRAALDLPAQRWTVARSALVERTTTFDDGSTGVWRDGVLRLDRLPREHEDEHEDDTAPHPA